MDTVLKKLERLADMAARQADPVPLDAGGIMNRIRGLDVDYGPREPLPLRFFAGGAMAAAAAAVFVAVVGVASYQEIVNPIFSLENLLPLSNTLEPLL